MSSEQKQPFNVGDEVEHKCGIVGTVAACERRVVHGSTRWVVDIDAGNGEKVVHAWPHNCKLVKAAQTVVRAHGPSYETGEPIETNDVVTVGNGSIRHEVRSYTHDHEWLIKVSGVGGVYRPNELTLVEKPAKAAQTVHVPKVRYGCSKAAAVGDMVCVRHSTTGNVYKVEEIVSAKEIRIRIPESSFPSVTFPASALEYVPTVAVRETVAEVIERAEKKSVALPNGWRVDAYGNVIPRRWRRPSFAGYYEQRKPDGRIFIFSSNGSNLGVLPANAVSHCEEIRMEPEELTAKRPDPNVAEAVDNLLVANLSSALVRALKFHAGGDEALRAEFARIIRADLAEHRPNNAEADLRERLEEATQEFARALSSEQSKTAEAIRKRDEARKSAAGWRSVVCTFEF